MPEGQKQEQGPKQAAPTTYHRDRLIAESGAFFGQPSHVVVGALDHARVGSKVNFTRDEVEGAIKDYLTHKVVPDAEQEG